MANSIWQRRFEELLALADVGVNGDRPWDIQVHNDRLYRRVLVQGELGLGESYMDGWWDCEALDEFILRVLRARLQDKVTSRSAALQSMKARLINLQKGARTFTVGERHYDIGNDLFVRMLDRHMIYSCGYWKGAEDLDQAQENKLDLVCRKLGLEPGMRVLDVGCGWGGTARFVSRRYGVTVTGVTVSREQASVWRLPGIL